MKTSNCDLPIGNLPDVLDVPVLGLFTKADTDSGVGKYQTEKKLLLKPEILSLLHQRTLSSPAGQWQLLAGVVLLCHPELVPELPLCSSHWAFSLPMMVSGHLSSSAGCLPCLSSSFPVPAV